MYQITVKKSIRIETEHLMNWLNTVNFKVQEDLLGTKVEKVLLAFTYISDPHLDLVPQEILVTAPELQEDLLGTKVISYCLLGLFLSSSIQCRKRCHGTRIARGLGWYNYW